MNVEHGFDSGKPQFKPQLQKVSHDLQMSLVAFQQAQKSSAERQRTVVDGAKLAVEEGSSPSGLVAFSSSAFHCRILIEWLCLLLHFRIWIDGFLAMVWVLREENNNSN